MRAAQLPEAGVRRMRAADSSRGSDTWLAGHICAISRRVLTQGFWECEIEPLNSQPRKTLFLHPGCSCSALALCSKHALAVPTLL